MPKKSTTEVQPSWSVQIVGLACVALVGSLIAYFVPNLPNSTSGIFARLTTVNFHQMLALVLTTALVVIFLAYYRAKMFFSTAWLLAAVVYNFLILFVKFTFSANQLEASRVVDANTFIYHFTCAHVISIALLVSILYLLVFGILYLFFSGQLVSKSLHKVLITTRDGKILLAVALFVFATLARIIIFRLPFFSNTSASTYLSDIFHGNTALLSAILFAMIMSAVETYSQVRRRSDLKYFLVTGLGLILSFHLWWAIFMYRGY